MENLWAPWGGFSSISSGFIYLISQSTFLQVNVQISFFEIYNEKIHDLLQHEFKDKLTGKKVNVSHFIFAQFPSC